MKKLFCLMLTAFMLLSLNVTVFAEEDAAIVPDGALTGNVSADYTEGTDAVDAGTVYSVQIEWTSIGKLHYQGATGGTYTWNPNTLQYEVSGDSEASWTDASVEIDVTNKSNTSILVQAKYADAGTGAQTKMKNWTDNMIEVGVGSAATNIDFTDTSAMGLAQTETITGIVTAEGSIAQNVATVGTITLTLHESGATIWEIEDGVLTGVALGDTTDLVIPENVHTIAANAFAGQTEITSIVIPEGIVSIGDGAFAGCTGLKTLLMPADYYSDMQYFGQGVFADCSDDLHIYVWSEKCAGIDTCADGQECLNIAASAFASLRYEYIDYTQIDFFEGIANENIHFIHKGQSIEQIE